MASGGALPVEAGLAVGGEAVAAQLGEAGYAPDLGADLVVLGEQLGRGIDLAEDRAGADQADLRPRPGGLANLVHAAQDALLGAFRHWRLKVVFVRIVR